MQTRRLGRTGHLSSLAVFGAAAFFHEISQAEANAALDLMESYGVNHIDIAPTYGFAELRTGPWLESRRDTFFLGCKTTMRDRSSAWADLHRSLHLLRTDHFDLYQLHAVTTFEELDAATQPGGAIEALQAAREQGLTRWLGITGHGMQAPAVFIEALNRFDFDTVMFPIHPRLYADPDYRRDAERLLDICRQRDVGVHVIKSITRGGWGSQERNYNTWYQPYDVQDKINQGVRFALSQPDVACIPTAGDVRLLPLVLEAAKNFTPMSTEEQAALIEESRDLALMFV
ncbi:MAG: aldo/keto reductase [Chloroflexi bacterium]|nr:aldo/keto reductase [Chloroflexota bacterium]